MKGRDKRRRAKAKAAKLNSIVSNNSWATKAVEAIAANVIGDGIKPQVKIANG